jgi:hypothetical protein
MLSAQSSMHSGSFQAPIYRWVKSPPPQLTTHFFGSWCYAAYGSGAGAGAFSYAGQNNDDALALRRHIQEDFFAYVHGHAPRFFLDQFSGLLSSKVRNAAGAATAIIDHLFSTLPRLIVLFVVSTALVARQAPQFLWLFGRFAVVFTLVAANLPRVRQGQFQGVYGPPVSTPKS